MNHLELYSFIQIVGESLPFSSSSILLLWTTFLKKYTYYNAKTIDHLESFTFLLHLPTLIILLIIFYKRWSTHLLNFLYGKKQTLLIALWLFVADSITCLFYILFKYTGTRWWSMPLGFLITTILIYSTRKAPSKYVQERFVYEHALILGTVQGLSLLPGISRFASTFATARWLGYRPELAAWYCFFIQIPLLAAASLKGFIVYPLATLSVTWYTGVFFATVVAYYVLISVLNMAHRCTFWMLSWYTLFLTVVSYFVMP